MTPNAPASSAGSPGWKLATLAGMLGPFHYCSAMFAGCCDSRRDRNFAPTFIDHDGPQHGTVGVDEGKELMASMYRQLPDLKVVVEDIIAENDRVVCRNTWRGTEASTGRKIVIIGIVIWRLKDGRIVERWASVQPPQVHVRRDD